MKQLTTMTPRELVNARFRANCTCHSSIFEATRQDAMDRITNIDAELTRRGLCICDHCGWPFNPAKEGWQDSTDGTNLCDDCM